jgi:hypothetical protein
VRLFGANIGGALACDGGTFRNPGGTALTVDSLSVDQAMYCRDGFTAEGEVRLFGAHIGGALDCNGGTFRNPAGKALAMQRAEIESGVLMGPAAFDGALDLPTPGSASGRTTPKHGPTKSG